MIGGPGQPSQRKGRMVDHSDSDQKVEGYSIGEIGKHITIKSSTSATSPYREDRFLKDKGNT